MSKFGNNLARLLDNYTPQETMKIYTEFENAYYARHRLEYIDAMADNTMPDYDERKKCVFTRFVNYKISREK